MKHVTYLLGAGASTPTMPLVKGIPDKKLRGINDELSLLQQAIKSMIYQAFEQKTIGTQSSQNQLELVEKKFEWLCQHAEKHASIDTFAKKLFIRGESKKLHDLKYVLSLLFTFLQCSRSANPKHDSFLASTIQLTDGRYPKFPDEIKILTWNYDLQMELAAMEYWDKKSPGDLGESFLFYPRQDFNSDTHNPVVVHLNGIAGLYETSTSDYRFTHLFRDFNASANEIIDNMVFNTENYQKGSLNFDNLFTFSWERKFYDDKIYKKAQKIASETEILVIIGYSFPFFNRDYDRKLFQEFAKNRPVIYIQNPNFDSRNLIEKFPEIKDCEIRQVSQTEQFHLPEEM